MTDNNRANGKRAQEWSHHISSEDVDVKPMKVSISVPKDSITALCNRLDLHSIESLDVDYVLARNSVSKVIHVKGKIKAGLHQKCVVSMEPVAETIDDSFEAWFAEPSNAVSFTKVKRDRMNIQEQSEQPMLGEHDDPEEIVDGNIDIGELAIQHLSLSLSPYPRSEDTSYDNKDEALSEEEGMYNNPFAALKDWKSAEKKKD